MALLLVVILASGYLGCFCENTVAGEIVNPISLFDGEVGLTLIGDTPLWIEDALPTAGFEISIVLVFDSDTDNSSMVLFGNKNAENKFSVRIDTQGDLISSSILLQRTNDLKLLANSRKAVFDPFKPLTLSVTRKEDSARLAVQIVQNGTRLLDCSTEAINTRNFLSVSKVGVVCTEGIAAYSDFGCALPDHVDNPIKQYLKSAKPDGALFYRGLSEVAVQDILHNFWDDNYPGGRLLPTWEGFPGSNLPDRRGALWEAGMLYFCIYDTWKATGNGSYKAYLDSYADYIRTNFSERELENAGGNQLWASDDCAWVAMLLLCSYSVTGDIWFADRAENLLANVRQRWFDPALGGLRYKDGADFMSLYEVGIALCYLRLWEITGENAFYDLALESYENMHSRLGAGRSDGLYFCEANTHWPIGDSKYIGEAGSTSFLAGNLGMAALSARFYRLTGKTVYLERVYRTNKGLLAVYVNRKGVLINDRDAWTNGTFTAWYVSEVLCLPDTGEMRKAIFDTALSIANHARTEDGYYGGSWSGPAEGNGSPWYLLGSVPQQSKTTGSTVLMIAAAALLEAKTSGYSR